MEKIFTLLRPQPRIWSIIIFRVQITVKPLFNVLAVFKNESRALPEWIEHYLSEGANRIILVNNNSTDDWKNSCSKYTNNKHVTFLEDNRKWSQVEIYDDVFFKINKETSFLLVCDLDEFNIIIS